MAAHENIRLGIERLPRVDLAATGRESGAEAAVAASRALRSRSSRLTA